MQRTLGSIALAALVLAIAGCDDDGDGTVDAGRDAGEEVDSGADAGGSAAPTITRVSWEAAPGCEALTTSDVDITVTVMDTDTPAPMLTFTGSAVGCTGAIDGASSTVECPNAAPYPSSITVTDPQGNSDTASFTFGPCETGMADF
jgi:hypothetical protein